MSDFTVLGGQGFIGRHLADHLRAKGHACHCPAKGDDAIFSLPLGHLVYAAGLTADFRSRPFDTVEAHVCLLNRLLQHGQFDTLTYLSSTRVYANGTDTRESATLQVNPNVAGDLYNLSKLMGESLCLHSGRAGTKVIRLSNIVGLRPDPDIFIDQLLEEGRRSGKIILHTRLESKKDYLSVDDATLLIEQIALDCEGGIFNVAQGEGIRNETIVQLIESELGFRTTVAADAAGWDFAPIDISRIRTRYGFSPRPFGEFFPRYLRDYHAVHCTKEST